VNQTFSVVYSIAFT